MKRSKILLIILATLCIFVLSACTVDKETVKWEDYFEVTYKRIAESQFDDPAEKLNALLNGTYVFAHDEYTIKNKTNNVLNSVYVVFKVKPAIDEVFEFRKIIGNTGKLRQGESDIVELSDEYIQIELKEKNYSTDQSFEVELVRIEFVI